MASGLSMPVGFKNGTDGNLGTAINAMKAAAEPHAFMGINQEGQVALLVTQGNPDGHVILRGGKQPNYDSVNIALAEKAMTAAGLAPKLVVDCSHGNSNKDYSLQPLVAENVVHQIQEGNQSIIGIMLESHLAEGNQSSEQPKSDMRYGVSITDACIGWDTTAELLAKCREQLAAPLKARLG
jgi:3-deoxy-7-phosphoheptulonate synthase